MKVFNTALGKVTYQKQGDKEIIFSYQSYRSVFSAASTKVLDLAFESRTQADALQFAKLCQRGVFDNKTK